jgi:uncharacterized protein YlbG (UPF0298 family)
MFAERTGFIIWLHDAKPARNLEKFGSLHYISRKMNYAVIYVNADRAEETMKSIQRLPYVKKVERSYRAEIPTEYNSNVPDKTRFYSY